MVVIYIFSNPSKCIRGVVLEMIWGVSVTFIVGWTRVTMVIHVFRLNQATSLIGITCRRLPVLGRIVVPRHRITVASPHTSILIS